LESDIQVVQGVERLCHEKSGPSDRPSVCPRVHLFIPYCIMSHPEPPPVQTLAQHQRVDSMEVRPFCPPAFSKTNINGQCLTSIHKCDICSRELSPRLMIWNLPGQNPKEYISCSFDEGGNQHPPFIKYLTSSRPALPLPTAHSLVPHSITNISATTLTLRCLHKDCSLNNRSVAGSCERQMCRTHCRSCGGCKYRDHNTSLRPSASASSLLPTSSIVSVSMSAPASSHTSIPAPNPTSVTMSPASADFPYPPSQPQTITHQTPPIFTQEQAELQTIYRRSRVLQSTLKHNESKQNIRLIAWSAPLLPPTLFDFDLLPGAKHFQVSKDILGDLGLSLAISLQKYDPDDGLWVGFRIGQTFTVNHTGQRFLLKDRDVDLTDCMDLDKYIESRQPIHIRDNL
jgi:hypothetical protein